MMGSLNRCPGRGWLQLFNFIFENLEKRVCCLWSYFSLCSSVLGFSWGVVTWGDPASSCCFQLWKSTPGLFAARWRHGAGVPRAVVVVLGIWSPVTNISEEYVVTKNEILRLGLYHNFFFYTDLLSDIFFSPLTNLSPFYPISLVDEVREMTLFQMSGEGKDC